MKKSRKIAAIILIVTILTAAVSTLFACGGAGKKTKIAIISDIHVMADEQIGNTLTESFEEKNMSSQKMLYLSNAIFKTALDKIADDGANVLLIAGDLTEDGARVSHEKIAGQLRKMEEKGIEVYVIPGNHDLLNTAKKYDTDVAMPIANVSPSEFKDIYADFGYAEALSTHEGTLSYTADIGKDYRLIAIDSVRQEPNSEGKVEDRNAPNVTDSLIQWAVNEVKAARDAGRMPIGMMHIPLIEHMGSFLDSTGITENAKVNRSKEFAAALTEAGLNIIFTGHVHMQNITAYEDENGKILDVQTACLSNYPAPIRYMTANKKEISLTTSYVEALKAEYIPVYAQADAQILTTNFRQFAYDYVDTDMMGKIKSKLSGGIIDRLLTSIGLSEDMAALARGVIVDIVVVGFLNTNMRTLRKTAGDYGVAIPDTEYKNIMGVAMAFAKALYAGDENFSEDSPEVALIRYSVYYAFKVVASGYSAIKDFLPSAYANIDLSKVAESLFKTEEVDISSLGIDDLIVRLLGKLLDLPENATLADALQALREYPIEDMLFGISVQDYIDAERGVLKFGALLDHLLFEVAKDGLLVDAPPADNNIKINRKTMEVTKIEA